MAPYISSPRMKQALGGSGLQQLAKELNPVMLAERMPGR